MKHTLKDLDQFFDAARNQTPMLDDKDFAAMLDSADAMSNAGAGSAEVMSQSPTSHIGSLIRTAINQHGGMIMTGVGLTTVTGLLITGLYLSSPDESKKPSQPAIASTQVETQSQQIVPVQSESKPARSVVVQSKADPVTSAVISEQLIRNPQKPPFRSDSTLWSNVKIEGVKPVEIPQQEIEALGITKEADGRVYLLHQPKFTNVTIKTPFPMELGSQFNMSPDHKVEGTIAPMMPTLVTDAKGKKLAFFFVFDSASPNFTMHSMSSMQREVSEDFPELAIKVDGSNEYEIAIDGDAASETTEVEDANGVARLKVRHPPMMNGLFDSLPSGMPKGMVFTLSTDDEAVLDSAKMPFNFKFKFNEEELNDNFGHGFDHEFELPVNVDSLVEHHVKLSELSKDMQQHAIMIQINADSIGKEVREQMKGLRGNMMKLRVDADSMRQQAFKMRDKVMQFRLDSNSAPHFQLRNFRQAGGDSLQLRNFKRMVKIDKNIIINRDSTGAIDFSKLPKPVIIADFRKQREMIDKLVPVQIVDENPDLKYNKNGLIFWYIPDEKFRAVAPESARELANRSEAKHDPRPSEKLSVVSRAGVIVDPLVYPNPSQGRSTFKFTLDEPRAVSIAVHDLLGKQVHVVSNAEMRSAGTFEQELDLSSLDAGVYLLVMVTDKGEQITQRVVIER